MKKLIQISLVVILVFVLFQAIAGGSTVSASQIGSSADSSIFFTADTSAEDVHTAACTARIKGVVCVMPNRVGWNT
jgi:hypothetical protein